MGAPKRSILDSSDPNNKEYARQSYNDAWGLYLGLVSGTNTLEDMPKARTFFKEAIAAYQHHQMAFEEARAQQGLSVVSGLLGQEQDCLAAAKRCLELLAPWTLPSAEHDPEKVEWAVKALRVVADTAPALERLRACKRGFDLLARLGTSEKWTRYRALFHRAAGVAEARRRPKTLRALRRGAAHLLDASAMLEALPVDRQRLLSSGKTLRELARVCRSLAKVDARAAKDLLAKAEQAARRGMELDREAGYESRWSHYHLAKILRDQGDREAASLERTLALRCRDSEREPVDADDHRISAADETRAFDSLKP